jgi:hypothetical protein
MELSVESTWTSLLLLSGKDLRTVFLLALVL